MVRAARSDLHNSGSHTARRFRRSSSLARLAYARDRRQSAASADHVRSRWREMAAGSCDSLAAWLREILTGAGWKRGLHSDAIRRLRRSRRRHVSISQTRIEVARTITNLAARHPRLPGYGLAAA